MVAIYAALDAGRLALAGGIVVGVNVVEVAPDYDHTRSTAILAAQTLLNLIGRMLHRP